MMLKNIITFLFLLPAILFAQVHNPVKWTFSSKKTTENLYELYFKASIEKGWHLYSSKLPDGDGPIPTSFRINENKKLYKLEGKIIEPKAVKEYDPNFMMELLYFKNEVVFKQSVQVLAEEEIVVSGELEYMVCNESMCLPPETENFSFKLKGEKKTAVENTEPKVKSDKQEPASSLFSGKNALNLEQGIILEPVKWSFSKKRISENKFLLIATASIDNGWHVYSQKLPSDEGPLATTFKFNTVNGLKPEGEVKERGELISHFDSSFAMVLNYYETKVDFEQVFIADNFPVNIAGELEFMVCNNSMCLPPETVPFEIEIDGKETISNDTTTAESEKSEKESYWKIFFIAFFSGLGALLTPCVFPMIPLTVSFFTKQSDNKIKGKINAVIYGVFILLIYLSFSVPFHLFDSVNSDIYNEISTNVYLNVLLFVVFIIFAFSFFGAFEITLPNSWINKADKASNIGGVIGIFFMALTLVLVSFTCTGPIIGGLLGATFSSAGGEAAKYLSVGMLGFGLAFGLPFGLFAFFPGWLNSLPKSGGWLNTVKVVFGFLELAFAFKFLSNADLVLQTGLLQREMFIAIWIVVFLLLSFYLLGFFRLSHDSEIKSVSIPRLLVAVMSLTFTVYMIPGLWGAPLKLISGFPPPMFYSECPSGVGATSAMISQSNIGLSEIPHGADPEHCPHNLPCFHEYDEALAYAKKVNKPLMIDFTGWACVNCRKMEEQVWSDPRVMQRLKDNVVLVSLYVDDRRELPLEEQKEVEFAGKTKKLKTVGNKWSFFQVTKYQTNSQPYYVIVDHNEKMLAEPAAYDPNIEKYINWLDRAVEAFKKSK